jgi:hypothetical protein
MNRTLLHPIALKKNTGLTPVKLFKATFEALNTEWTSLTPENPDSLTFISKQRKRYTSYQYPQETDNGIICLKTSLSDIPAIVLIDASGKERRLTYVGNINSKLTHNNGFVYWSEYVPGLRWAHENYSVVKQLNLQTLAVETILRHSKYFAPTATTAAMAEIIAVFEHEPNGQNNIVLLSQSGDKLKSYPVIDNMPVQDMVIDTRGTITASLTGNGNAIFQLDTNTAKWKKLLDYRRTNIESLQMCGKQLLFESGYNGVNNIYSFDTSSLAVKRLTNARYGSFSGTFSRDGGNLYVSDYSAKGYRIASIAAERLHEKPVDFDTPYKFKTAENLSAQESFNIDEYKFDDTVKYESSPYRKVENIFNIHSWFPFYLNVDEVTKNYSFEFNSFKPGITLLSQNRLNTFTSQASYYYDNVGKAHHGFLSLRYSGLFPVFQLKLDAGGRKGYLFYDPSENYEWYEDANGKQMLSRYRNSFENQTRVSATFSAYLPLNLTKGYYLQRLQPFINYQFVNSVINYTNQNYRYFHAGVYYYCYRTLAHNDIFPKFGVQAWLNYVGHPNIKMSELLIAKANVYLPGLLRNHSLRLSGSAQHQFVSDNTIYYLPEKYVDIARGYNYYTVEHTGSEAKNLFTFKGDYSFPIIYPDIKAGSIVYLSRIRGNMFYDNTVNHVDYYTENYHITGILNQPSYGFDLIFDLHFFRIKYTPLTLMFRSIKIPKHDLINNISIGVTF